MAGNLFNVIVLAFFGGKMQHAHSTDLDIIVIHANTRYDIY